MAERKKLGATKEKAPQKKVAPKKAVTKKKVAAKKATSKKKVAAKKVVTKKKVAAKKVVTKKKVAANKATTKKKTAPKMAANQKTTPKMAAPVQKTKKRLSKSEVEHFKALLLDKRRQLLHNVANIEVGALRKSRQDAAGDLSSMPLHMADIGSDTFEQEFALGLMASERELLHEIDDALLRIEDRSYGICEATNVLIRPARLEYKPWAKYCVEYARKLEEENS